MPQRKPRNSASLCKQWFHKTISSLNKLIGEMIIKVAWLRCCILGACLHPPGITGTAARTEGRPKLYFAAGLLCWPEHPCCRLEDLLSQAAPHYSARTSKPAGLDCKTEPWSTPPYMHTLPKIQCGTCVSLCCRHHLPACRRARSSTTVKQRIPLLSTCSHTQQPHSSARSVAIDSNASQQKEHSRS